jgi:formylglycine-generating enzyme required for sulfatase activity
MGNNPSDFKAIKRPVDNVSWNDIVQKFLPELNKVTGRMRPTGTKYRLPTEAEWEYAARGGKYWDKYSFYYSGSDKLDEVGWYDESQDVGLKTPNLLGLYDMSGNIEWCQDWYDSEFYKTVAALKPNPCNTVESSKRILRGGSFFRVVGGYSVPLVYRSYFSPDLETPFSFRLVLSPIFVNSLSGMQKSHPDPPQKGGKQLSGIPTF